MRTEEPHTGGVSKAASDDRIFDDWNRAGKKEIRRHHSAYPKAKDDIGNFTFFKALGFPEQASTSIRGARRRARGQGGI